MSQHVNPLSIIDTELAKASAKSTGSNNKRQVFLYLKVGHTALIRPLYELNNCLALLKHDIYEANDKELQIASICAAEVDQECFFCLKAENEGNKRLLANYRIYLPIFIYNVKDESGSDVYDDSGNLLQGVKILELGAFGKIGDVLRFFRTYMKKDPITGSDFSYYHKEDDRNFKTFELKEMRKKPINPKVQEIIPSLETIKQHVLEAYAPSILDDGKAEEYMAESEVDDLLPTNFTGL